MASKAMRHLTTLSALPLIDGVLLLFTVLVHRCPQLNWRVASIPRGVYGSLGMCMEIVFVLERVLHRCALMQILHRSHIRVMLLRDDV
jgi:hypothetical protein